MRIGFYFLGEGIYFYKTRLSKFWIPTWSLKSSGRRLRDNQTNSEFRRLKSIKNNARKSEMCLQIESLPLPTKITVKKDINKLLGMDFKKINE